MHKNAAAFLSAAALDQLFFYALNNFALFLGADFVDFVYRWDIKGKKFLGGERSSLGGLFIEMLNIFHIVIGACGKLLVTKLFLY